VSVSYSIFVKKEISFLKISVALEKILNCSFRKEPSDERDLFRTDLLGLEISLLEAVDYVGDRDLKLSQYGYQISVDYLPNAFDIRYVEDWRIMTSLIIVRWDRVCHL
jgi:hypothetical protein